MGQDSHGASVGLLSGADGLVNRSGRQNTGPTDAANACREPPGAQEARTSPPTDSKEVVLPSTLVLVQGDPCWPLEIQGCWVINLCCSKPLTCGMVICYRNSRETIEMNINRNQVTENMRYSPSAWGGRLRWSLTKSRGKTAFQMQRWDSPRERRAGQGWRRHHHHASSQPAPGEAELHAENVSSLKGHQAACNWLCVRLRALVSYS